MELLPERNVHPPPPKYGVRRNHTPELEHGRSNPKSLPVLKRIVLLEKIQRVSINDVD
jgi:hypothetical protein